MNLIIKLPNAIKEPNYVMHKRHCKHCPSATSSDPECDEIKKLSHNEKVKTAFPCGWRPTKFCKGYCDAMGITNEDLLSLKSNATN